MQKLLMKRTLRDLKANALRYASLFILIVASIFLILSLVGSSESVIYTVDTRAEANHLEDGQFQAFFPLEKETLRGLEKDGVTVEAAFFLDFTQEDGSTLRVFRNRERVDLVEINEGSPAKNEGEIVLEYHYAAAHGLSVGDALSVGGTPYTVTGVGSSPDYDCCLRNMSDAVADGKVFGTGFVTEASYAGLKAHGQAARSEEYRYSFLLNGAMTAGELKDRLLELKVDRDKIRDIYFLEMLDEIEADKNKLTDGIGELVDGADELKDGADELADGSDALQDGIDAMRDGIGGLQDGAGELEDGAAELADGAGDLAGGMEQAKDGSAGLTEGAEQITQGLNTLKGSLSTLSGYGAELNSGAGRLCAALLDALLSQANETLTAQLSALGLPGVTLTAQNYQDVLDELIEALAGSPEIVAALSDTRAQLDAVASFPQQLKAYTDGVLAAASGAKTLGDGGTDLAAGAGEMEEGLSALSEGANALKDGADALKSGVKELDSGVNTLAEGADTLAEHGAELTDGMAELTDGIRELADGAHELQDQVDEVLDAYFNVEPDNLMEFIEAEDNLRVKVSKDDVRINISTGIVAGIIVLILFTYVISVFVVHAIERERAVIGTLYAMGVKRRQLLMHYLAMPVLVALLGAVVGTALGYSEWGLSTQMMDSTGYYSIPVIQVIYRPYLLVYGLVMPPVIAGLVNYLVINRKLNQPALGLLRGGQKALSGSNVQLKGMGFIRLFQIRQFLREKRTAFTVLFGLFVSLLILMLGMNALVYCSHLQSLNTSDTKYEYMYTYKYPTAEPPADGTAAYVEGLNRKNMGYDLNVPLVGLSGDNPYFDFTPAKGKNQLTLSEGAASKFGLDTGDEIILRDEVNGMDYGFTVAKIVPYSVGLHAFMDIGSMRELFGREKDYYNVVYADHALDIDSGRLYAVSTKRDIEEASGIFLNMMMSMIVTMILVAIVVFLVVMYQMVKVMVDRSAFSISLMKIFGFRKREIRRLYLDGNFLLVAVSALIAIPLSKLAMDALYPYFVSNVTSGLYLGFSWQVYAAIYTGVIACYLVISGLLGRRLKRVNPAEVLKNRE